MKLILIVTVFTALLTSCGPRDDGRTHLMIFAAASLADLMPEIEEAFELRSEVDVSFSYGGSQFLAQQVTSGAPADVLISAGKFPMDFLEERDLLEKGWSGLLTNRLVVTSPTSGHMGLKSLSGLTEPAIKRITIANPRLAPAGRYAQESLVRSGLWDALRPKLVFGSDVRATLAFVEAGNAEAGIVYLTDAKLARNVSIWDIVPDESYSPITYPVAVVARSRAKAAAREFIAFLRSGRAESIFLKHGFGMAE